mmetsp:Transcript_94820/g.149990  ORF Transcript_94820/g.149990 Transcript_94820/m.149990 type:complete len:163 (+) Transcript_94820:54-542(+)
MELLRGGLQAAQDRYEAAKGGKKLLDEGGENAEKAILAKQTACDAVATDADIIQRVKAAAAIFEEAALKLREAKKLPPVAGITGYEDFERLADTYDARAKVYRQISEMLKEPPAAPEMSPAEKDASTILKMRGRYAWTMTKSAEGFEVIKKKATEASSSSAT